jgi:thiamine biosynthesis lipoprotein
MSLDVGSVAKGFAVQRIIDEVLQSDLAVKDFIIDAGGNVGIAGTHRVRETGVWRVDVLNPLNQNAPLASFDVFGGMSVVTSGNYMRYYTHNGLVMGHIISPSTLMPADHFTAVTVVSRNSAVADVLSTAIFILPYQAGLDLAERYAIDAVWLMQDGTVRTYPLF